ncbi:putative PXMP2/4 family protein 4 [Iris pallida]|uniref:PXMP2/4 family protein 4 n=1 Tax=Iris pallida TaxID=29817 RepID=A0AAX6HXV6_IRIPA|nr:putative PXMP2/4 family protein 4 [Iris pallida]KAJ6845628.1 putative PXMP2/4 family protein 4 [Iris pallida]
MSGSILRNGGRRAHQLLLHSHSSSPSSKFKASSFPPPSSSHFSPARSSFSSSSSSSNRNGFIGWYLRMIETRPILTKSLTAGAIFATADVSSQMITLDPSCSLDLIRTLRMAGYGMMISGPSLHLWFNFVSRILPKRDILTTFKKMFLGQAVYGPIMTAVFFSFNAALQGETNAEIFARLKRDFIPTMKSCLVYWPMCDFITFKFVPVRLQPLVSNSFSYLWTIYITYMASLQKASVEQITDGS